VGAAEAMARKDAAAAMKAVENCILVMGSWLLGGWIFISWLRCLSGEDDDVDDSAVGDDDDIERETPLLFIPIPHIVVW